MKKNLLMFLCLFACCLVNAQRKNTVALQPLYVFNGGLRLDVERQLASPSHWLQLSISGYYLPNQDDFYESWITSNSDFEEFNLLKGIGAGLAYKYFFYSNLLYSMPAISYNYYEVGYNGYGYFPYMEDGLTKYEYRLKDSNQYFNKLNGSLSAGFQTPLTRAFFFDCYLGIGYSYSSYKKDRIVFNKDNIFGFERRGLTVTTVIRLGFAF